MKTLLVAATEAEIAPFLKSDNYKDSSIDLLISGLGITFTTFELTQHLMQKKYDLVINVGIAGSFSQKYPIGTVVQVTEEQFADLAYETQEDYETFFESPFLDANTFPFKNGKLLSEIRLPFTKTLNSLPKVKGITVNKVHGQAESISIVQKKFDPDVESMEGAAVFYVCKQLSIPVLQIRSVSNFVEPRNKENWNIPLAINRLNKFLNEIFS